MADRASWFFVGGVVSRGIRRPWEFGVSQPPNHISKRGRRCFPLVVLFVSPHLSHPLPPRHKHPENTSYAIGNGFKVSGEASCESVYSVDRLQCYTADLERKPRVQVSQPHTEIEAGLWGKDSSALLGTGWKTPFFLSIKTMFPIFSFPGEVRGKLYCIVTG